MVQEGFGRFSIHAFDRPDHWNNSRKKTGPLY